MSAESIAKALGGRRAGRTWMARCPAHEDWTPSLAIREGRDGKVLVRCHAGCSQWDVIGALRDRGMWGPVGGSPTHRPMIDVGRNFEVRDDGARKQLALRLWGDGTDAQGTVVETYLRSRGLTIVPPGSLRFHRAMKHPSGGIWPAMVGLVTGGADGTPIGIHRTFLARDGSGKAAVSPSKMMLGPCRGGVVRLEEAGDSVMVGEGIETALAAMRATGLPAWAALSTSGMKTLILPDLVREVIILADADPAGEAAAREASKRWLRDGRRVRIARPAGGCKDFNDVLLAGAEGTDR